MREKRREFFRIRLGLPLPNGIPSHDTFVTDHSLALGQCATEEKSNEITAIPELLQVLSLKGCIVSIDAMETQTVIVETLRDKGADYLLPVKANQPALPQTLHQSLEALRNDKRISV